MRRFRLALQVTGAVLCLTSVLLDAPADAAPAAYESAVMTPLYAPGNASALRPSYDGNYIVFACQYNAWVSTPIYWSCELWTTTGYKVDSRSNSCRCSFSRRRRSVRSCSSVTTLTRNSGECPLFGPEMLSLSSASR